MKLDFRNNKDFWSGLMFFATGSGAILAARNYPFGTTLRMGPGYFPIVLSVILMLFGLHIALRGVRKNEKIRGNWSIRAMLILPFSIVLFGMLMESAGFVPALAALVLVSAASGREFKIVEVLLLTLCLGALSVTLFIWGLGLPYPLINGF